VENVQLSVSEFCLKFARICHSENRNFLSAYFLNLQCNCSLIKAQLPLELQPCSQLSGSIIITRESSYCFQRVLAITILSVCLSVCPSVCHTGGSVKNGTK